MLSVDIDFLRQQLKKHEGVKNFPYVDTTNHITIGCGRNLSDIGISTDEIEYLLTNDINRTAKRLETALSWIKDINPPRQTVLLNMAFNMGVEGLRKFHTTLGLIQTGKYEDAATAMLQSKWATQVGHRAVDLAQIMRSGLLP